MDPGLRPLVCLDEGTNYHGVLLDVGPLCLVGHSGDGEGVGGVLGLSQQVLMGPLVPVLGQLRGVAGSRSLGVSRCRSFGMVETGSEVRHGDFAHLDLQIRGHLRPDVRNCLHVGGGGHGRGDGGAGAVPLGASWSRARDRPKSKGSHRGSGCRIQACWSSRRAVSGGAEAVRRVVSAEFLVVDPGSDIVVRLGGARGCTTDEGNLQGRGECRTRKRAWQLVSCYGTVSCW